MNDIVEATGADINLFTDDTSVCVTDSSPCRLQQKMQHAVEKLAAWFSSWALSINNKKSALMVFTSRKSVPSVAVSINGEPIRHVVNHKHLGLVFDSHLSWSAHATALVNKVSQRVGLLRRLRCRLPPLVIRSLYLTAIRPALEYTIVAWSGIRSGDAQRLERVQRSAARLITGISPSDRLSSEILLARAGLDPLHLRRQAACAAFAFSLSPGNHDHFPPHMAATLTVWQDLLPRSTSSLVLRSSQSGVRRLPRPRTELFRRSPFYLSFSLLNAIPPTQSSSLLSVRSHFLSSV